MNYRIIVLFSTLFFLVSCSNEDENEENLVIAGKDLTSISHVFYNYLYSDQPATRTYTTNYTLNENKINSVNTSEFNYWHEEPDRNYTWYGESIFSYDVKNRLIKVAQESYSDYDLTDTYFYTIEFDYYEDDKIKGLVEKDGSGTLRYKYYFVYLNNTIERKIEYYEDGNLIFYYKTIFHTDSNQRIYRQISKGPIFANMDPNLEEEYTQEASFDEEGNVYRTYFEGSPLVEYEYSDIKIPSELPNINLPFFSSIPFDILLAQFDKIVESHNANYINSIIPLEPTNPYTTIFKNTLSKDNYPLSIEVFLNDRIRSETIYMYE